MTERLYYTDTYQRAFTARVVGVERADGAAHPGLVLDRTIFYPTSGGQPHDTGTLGGLPVINVLDAGERIVHVIDGELDAHGIVPGVEVPGTVDWERRFDHMQQHTGQHVLSAAFVHVLRADTVSVHLGASSTLDLALPTLTLEDARRVEDRANEIVFEDRPVTIRFVDAGDAEALGLRRPPRREGAIRIVEVEGFDRSACGGTHVRRTGEIGPLLIRRWERVKGQVRVEFLCGWRALRDYRWKHALVAEWSARLTVGDHDVGAALERLAGDARERERALGEARRRLIGYEAAERLAARGPDAGLSVLRLEFPRRDPDEVRSLLREMVGRERCIVLAGITETGQLYFSRSAGEGPDMAALLARACQAVGGRGGGTVEFAQGAVPPGEAVARVLGQAEAEIRGA